MLNNFKATLRKYWGRSEASATNTNGEPLCRCSLETVFVVSACTKDARATEAEARQGLEAIESEIEQHAWRAGVGKVWVLLSPEDKPQPDEKWIRIIESRIPQISAMPEVALTTSAQATQYIN